MTVQLTVLPSLGLHNGGDHLFAFPPSPRPWRSPFWLASVSQTVEISIWLPLVSTTVEITLLTCLRLHERGEQPFHAPLSLRSWRGGFSLASLQPCRAESLGAVA